MRARHGGDGGARQARREGIRAARGGRRAILDGGGDIDFLIIGSTPMDNPAMIFGNPRPSSRVLKKGDIINMELAAGYRGYTAQVGSPITLGAPTEMVRKFWNEITLPGYHKIVAEIAPGKPAEAMREAAKFFRDKGVQSRPTQCHGIDLVTDNPHVTAEHVRGVEGDMILKPGMVIMAEPNPITADGMFGIFLGHTFIVTADRPRGGRQVPAGDRGGVNGPAGAVTASVQSPVRGEEVVGALGLEPRTR